MQPFVRHMLLCEQITSDPKSPLRVGIKNLLSTVYAKPGVNFPINQPFCVYVLLSAVRSDGELRLTVTSAETDELVYTTPEIPILARPDPLEVLGVTLQISQCVLDTPGFYWVDLWYNGEMLAQQGLMAKEHKS